MKELNNLIKVIEKFVEENKENESIKSQVNSLYCTLLLIESQNTKEVKMEDDFETEEDEDSESEEDSEIDLE